MHEVKRTEIWMPADDDSQMMQWDCKTVVHKNLNTEVTQMHWDDFSLRDSISFELLESIPAGQFSCPEFYSNLGFY